MSFEGNHERREKKDSDEWLKERRTFDSRLDDIENPRELIAETGFEKGQFLPQEKKKERIEKKKVDDDLELFRHELLRKYPETLSKSNEAESEKWGREALPEGKSKRERKPLSWEYVAAFFDGEGSINVTARNNSVDLSLTLTQVDRRSLGEIAGFLKHEKVRGLGVYVKETKERNDIHSLVISANEGVEQTLGEMMPYLRVKVKQAIASLDYLSDRSTGNEYLSIMNEETRAGRRAGRIHEGDLPHTRAEGIRIAREESMAQARAVYGEMRKSPVVRERERLNAIDRNKNRGTKVRDEILELLESDERDIAELSGLIGRSKHQTNLHLKEMSLEGLVKRGRESAADSFVYELTEKGRA